MVHRHGVVAVSFKQLERCLGYAIARVLSLAFQAGHGRSACAL
ncbi:hypothetical protein [Lysobacter gummosus]